MGKVTLFAYSAGNQIRLGTVAAVANSTVRIPWSGAGQLAILIYPPTGSPFETNSLDVREGEVVRLRIEDRLESSELYK